MVHPSGEWRSPNTSRKLLIILIDTKQDELALLLCEDLDSPCSPVCLLSTGNTKAAWTDLKELASTQRGQ
jgi:hypothetical protein